jgi:DNA-damage-inducible protein J
MILSRQKPESACAAMGMTMSDAINNFLTKVANERRIPFKISKDSFYSDEHIEMLEKRIADMKAGSNMQEHDLIEVE